jgi:hypothetical protein
MKTEIREFLIQYPEFNNDNFRVKSIESNRYNGDYTINVFDYDYEDGEWVFLKSYWCKFWNNEAETTYQFEEERFIRYKSIRVNIDDSDLVYGAHYDYNENDYIYENPEYRKMFGDVNYNKIENNVVDAWQKDNEQKVREEIARKILSGEIKLNFYCSDSDAWEAPYSQIEKIYNV